MQNKNKSRRKNRVIFLLGSLLLVAGFFLFQTADFSQGATATDQVNLSVTVAETISLDCGADVDLGTLTPGTPVSASSVCTTATNANGGYDVSVKRDDADTTMDHSADASTNITDKTAWNRTTPNAAVYASSGLAFSVFASTATKNTTWWGTGTSCHDASNLYAGFPTAYTNIMEHATYSSGSTTTSICYRVDVPATQKSGSYTGSVTYQVTSKP
jgi:hypothetical protein